ncbi:MAG: type II secretion system F family protein, partial [Ruthenibacterium lactatiformans]|nr:type II secretion system F family protein [Ruthenibacterium lactatiformans]
MAAKILRSLAVSAFCEDMAMMLAAGIQVDDALSLMRGDSGDGPLYDAASAVLERVQMGEPLAEAVEQCGYFPAYAAQLVAAGEAAGRTESVLKSLAVYYETQDKLEKRLKSAVIYPAVLLFLMAGVLAVLVARVLPVFTGVYTGLAGSVAASSYAYITAANIIGWASLCLVIVLTALLLTGAAAAR